MAATMADVFEHEDRCADCRPGRPCARAEVLFAEARAAIEARFAPPAPPIEVIDYPAHERTCTRCKPLRACPVGRELLNAAARAFAEVHGRTVRA